MAHSDYQALIAQGKLAEAAGAMEADGQFRQAAELYQQLWDFESASRTARAAGDFPTALSNQLQLRQPQLLEQLLAEIERANPQLAALCARVGVERGAWLVAARLYHTAEMPDAAARCLEQAGDLGAAARTLEQVGQIRRAMELYQRHLSELEEASATPDVMAEPCFHLGRLLLRFGHHEEAIPLLQRSWSASDDDALALRAGRAVAVGLARLGYNHAAGATMELLRTRAVDHDAPSLDECLNDPDLVPIGSDDSTKVLAGRYRLGHLLGSGGMGRVYMAVDQLTEQRVAVKIFTAPGGARGRDAYRRFVKEARATGQLQHPHIVNLLDFHEEMGFMVLEHMDGGTLEDRLRPRLTPAACRTVVLQVLSGLGAAHQRGIVHRDIKPSNIFFSTAGAAKLGDFGVAHLQDAGQTQTGAFVGTLAFMSPEQIKGEVVTFATDVYALGVMLFQILTGQLPFVQPDLVTKHLTTPPPLPSSILPALGSAFDETIMRCLEKDPSQRFDSLGTLRQAVERFPHGPDPVSGPDETRTPAPRQPQRRASDRRFVVESTVMDVAALQVLEARDTRLGRAVLLLRIAPGPRRAPLLDLILLAAGQGGESLQRVMSIDRDMGQATLETPHQAGEPPSSSDPPIWGPDEAIHIARQIGHALAPLHAAGQVHGAMQPNQLTCVGGMVVVSLLGALEARALDRPLPSPADEVAQVVLMLGLSGAPPLVDGTNLAQWADEQRCRRMRLEPQQRLELLVARALADAPSGVDRR